MENGYRTILFDIHAMGTKDVVPVYRLYIDGYLMTERDYFVDNFLGFYIQEQSPIITESKDVLLELDWVISPFTYELKNFNTKESKIKEIHRIENTKDNFKARLIL